MHKKITNEFIELDFSRIFLGLFIVFYGLSLLFSTLGFVSINIQAINLIPIFIIFLGLSFLDKKSIFSNILGAMTLIACFIAIFYTSFIPQFKIFNTQTLIFDTPISVSLEEGVERGEITLNTGVGELNIRASESNNLINGILAANFMKIKTETKVIDRTQKIKISSFYEDKLIGNANLNNEFILGINKNIPVKLYLNTGASNNIIDLREIMAEFVNISAGASNIDLKLGDKVNTSSIFIEAGVSFINISLPKNVGVKIFDSSGLSSKDFKDFIYVDEKVYQSLNYNSAEKKINIEAKIGLSNIVINWYEEEKKETINLYYYNNLSDKENTCDADFVLPIKREISSEKNNINDVINLLIKGDLTRLEKDSGFSTEFPNSGFNLLESSVDEQGKLTLKFTEVPGFTSGGSCRVNILANQIIKTAKQFSGIKEVIISPESIFEP